MATLFNVTAQKILTPETLRSAAKQSERCLTVPVRLRLAIMKFLREQDQPHMKRNVLRLSLSFSEIKDVNLQLTNATPRELVEDPFKSLDQSKRWKVKSSYGDIDLQYRDDETVAYVASRIPAVYSACFRVLTEVCRRLPDFSSKVLDFGAGTSSAFWALREVWPKTLEKVNLVEPSQSMQGAGRSLIQDMLHRRVHSVANLFEIIQDAVVQCVSIAKHSYSTFSTMSASMALPTKLKKSERKPLVRSINELKREARLAKKQRRKVQEMNLQPPENGLLVKKLIPAAHQVYAARTALFSCVSLLINEIAIYSCSVCGEVHVGDPPHKIKTCNFAGSLSSKEHKWSRGGIEHVLPTVESYHLYDRIGRAVSHNEQLEVDRIPAIVELCIQAGLNIPEYPTRRRTFPIYSISGKNIDFEQRFPKYDSLGDDISPFGFWHRKGGVEIRNCADMHSDDVKAIATKGMKAWEEMRSSASTLMNKYSVQTCGYCSEVQVGPKGHRVRNCLAYKHQMRGGQHAWQEATIDDLVPPVYVWHVRNHKSGLPLVNSLKRYYGMLPAVVELFVHAGAHVSEEYANLMKHDVVVPEMEEEKWVA